jgi:hypothetical protein
MFYTTPYYFFLLGMLFKYNIGQFDKKWNNVIIKPIGGILWKKI